MKRHYTAREFGIVGAKLAELRARAERHGWEISIDVKSETDEHGDVVAEFTFGGSFHFDGGWTLIAVADASETTEPIIHSFEDGVEVGEVDMSRCDHCHRAVRRNKVLMIRNAAGEVRWVGSSCALDFLGHDPYWATFVMPALDADEDGWEIGGAKSMWTVETILRFAIEANRLGYTPVKSERVSTKRIVSEMLSGLFWSDRDWRELRWALAESPAATIEVEELVAWMVENDGAGEFATNLARLARMDWVGSKWLGLLAYAPAGYAKAKAEESERLARESADAERRAAAKPLPVSSDRVRVEGEIATRRYVENAFGGSVKVRVVSDDGWAVWGTLPAAIGDAEVGDRIAFVARLSPSEDDELFGFFSRPSKAEVLS